MRRMMPTRFYALLLLAAVAALMAVTRPTQAQVGVIAVDDSYSTPVNTPLNVLAPGILANDVSAFTLSADLVSGPAHGTLTFLTTGAFDYNPALNFVGGDSFTYRASDGANLSNVATVRINVGRSDAVPEPGTYALLSCLAVPGVMMYRRRRA